MRRREFIALMGASVALPFAATAQEAGRTYRLGIVTISPPNDAVFNALFDGLRRLGFIEGKNLTVETRVYGQHPELLADSVAGLLKAKVDVIYAAGPARIRAVQQATKTIPIVGIADDMLNSGLVASLAHPNGNTTGVSILGPELDGKRLEILIEAVPGLRRMAALADVYTTSDDRGLEEAARERNVALSIYRVAKGDEIVAAIHTAHAWGATASMFMASPIFYLNRQYDHRAGRSTAPASHVSIPRNSGTRRLCRLRAAPPSALWGGSCPGACHVVGCPYSDRATDQVRTGDQPQDRQCAWHHGARRAGPGNLHRTISGVSR